MNNYCGDSINNQFGRSRTCKAGDGKCTNCELLDAQQEIRTLKEVLKKVEQSFEDHNLDTWEMIELTPSELSDLIWKTI